MPVIFSPGEAETRPLNPDDIVYTTAQKVADLLGIGPQEAILASHDSDTNGVYVTGADYRDHGFQSGDTILIYSDDDPMGIEKEISTPTTSTNGVKLPFATGTVTAATYTVAKNTYIQNTASFTNGKTRGMKRSTVEDFIKRTQDRIDSEAHNAWRPTLVNAEYINFDTYKPYRRRYYTDYVGTAPLLFRNVQQILRLEVWQGDDYRDLAGSEARLEIVDHAGLSGDSICFGMANGSAVTLTAGTAATQWRPDFDKVSAAQNLADLINKEDRVSKSVVDFSPTFTLEGSTSNIAVHNEILATANSDYGNGKVKVTSLRQTKGGENVSIASTDLTNLTISQVTENSATSAVMATAITFAQGDGVANSAGHTGTITTSGGVGSKFAVGDSVYNANGTLIGAITTISTNDIRINQSTGGILVKVINGETLYTARMQSAVDTDALIVDETSLGSFPAGGVIMIGSGETVRIARYTSVDSITVTATVGEGSADALGVSITKVYGRLNGVVDVANSFINNVGGASASGAKGTAVFQRLLQSDIGAFSDLGGDQGRLKDWWIDYEMGIIYFNNSYPYFEWNAIKVAYIYGERYVEKAIEEAATKMVASDLLMSDDRSVLIPEGSQNVDLGAKIQIYRNQAKAILSRYKEVVVFE
jgi:hypothetical protein